MAVGPVHAGSPAIQLSGGDMHDRSGHHEDSLWVQLAKRFGISVGLFVAGAILAFVYSYVPLHNAKNWEIGYLEERLEAKDQQLVQLETKVSTLESDVSLRPEAETFKLMQEELATTDKTIKELERRLARSEKRVKELERARTHWKKKFDAAEAAAAAAPAPVAAPAPAASAASDQLQGGVAQGGDVEIQADLAGGEDAQSHQ